jgi:hypothetical protein
MGLWLKGLDHPSVVHKYVTSQLFDEREIRKTLDPIDSSRGK